MSAHSLSLDARVQRYSARRRHAHFGDNVFRSEGFDCLLNIVPVEGFDARDLFANHVKYQDPFVRRQSHVSVIRPIRSSGSRAYVERGAEIVTTTASANDSQHGKLSRELRFV